MTNAERRERRSEAALKGAQTRAATSESRSGRADRPASAPRDPRSSPCPGHPQGESASTDRRARAQGEPPPQRLALDGPAGPPRRPRSVGGEAAMTIVRFEQVNAPRRGQPAAGRSGRPGRAAGPRRPGRRDAATPAPGRGRDPRPGGPRPWRETSSPRCGRSGRSGPGPGGASRAIAPGDDPR